MATKYNIKSSLDSINDVTVEFDKLSDLTTPGTSSYIDLTASSNSIQALVD